MSKPNQALCHEKYLLNLMITLAAGNLQLQNGINIRRSTICETFSRKPLFYQSYFESYVQKQYLKKSTLNEIEMLNTIDKRIQVYKIKRLNAIVKDLKSKKLNDSKNIETLTEKETIKPSGPYYEHCETINFADDLSEILVIHEKSQGVNEAIVKDLNSKKTNDSKSIETFTEMETIKPYYEDCETINFADEVLFEIPQFLEMSHVVNDEMFHLNSEKFNNNRSIETLTENETNKHSGPCYEDCKTIHFAVDLSETPVIQEMSHNVNEMFDSKKMNDNLIIKTDPVNPVTDSESEDLNSTNLFASVPDSSSKGCESLNCADEVLFKTPEMSQNISIDTLPSTSTVSENDSSDAKNTAIFYKTLNRDSTREEMLEALRNCVGDEGVAKLKNLFESENKISIKASKKKKEQTRKRQLQVPKPDTKRKTISEIDKLNEDLKNSFIAEDVMRATGKRKCASKKIDYNVISDEEEDIPDICEKRQRKQSTYTGVDKYYDDASPHGSRANQKMDQKSSRDRSKIKFIVNVVEHGNLEFIVDEGLLTYLSKKK